MLQRHALMILGENLCQHYHHHHHHHHHHHQHPAGRCASVVPVIKSGLQSLKVSEGDHEELMFISYLIKTGTYIAAELSSLFQECASVIQQHQQPHGEAGGGRGGGEVKGDATAIAPFLLE